MTDGEQRSALAIVRSLGRAGHYVAVCSAMDRPLAGASRYCGASHPVADPAVDPAGFRRDVAALVERHALDVVIPATDLSASPMLDLRSAGAPVAVAFPEEGAYRAVSDKRLLLDQAHRMGVSVPEQVVVEHPTEEIDHVRRWAGERGFDVVLKPSRSAVAGRGRFGVSVIGSEHELRLALAAYPSEAYPVLVQARISGPGLGVFLLADRGEPVATFAHRRIREKPPTGGVSVYRESVAPRDDIRRAAETILRQYEWTGVAMVEFKEDARTGEPFLMEVNGRFWGSLQLAIDAGVDFPEMLVRVTMGEAVERISSYRVGVRSRWLWGDLDHLLWVVRNGHAARGAFPELPSAMGAIMRFALPWRPGDRLEVLRPTDPRPFLRESAQWIGATFGKR